MSKEKVHRRRFVPTMTPEYEPSTNTIVLRRRNSRREMVELRIAFERDSSFIPNGLARAALDALFERRRRVEAQLSHEKWLLQRIKETMP